MTETVTPAGPVPDSDSQFFWQGLRNDQVLMQNCDSCERFRFPPMPYCPFCRSGSMSIKPISGRGTIYSWIVANRAFAPAFAADVPYTVATVDFEEGVRAAVRVEGNPDLEFGLKVRAKIRHHADWSELRVEADD